MSALMLFLFLVMSTAISFWNAYASGAMFTETKIIGGWSRFMTWCGLVMSACGFTWVYLTILTMLAVALHKLSVEDAQLMFKLGYMATILPVLGSGFAIWADSVVRAFRHRSFGNTAIAGWNTVAQARNTWQAARVAPNFVRDIMNGLGKKRGKDSGGVLIVLLLILAVCGGAITTGLIARWADRRVAIDVTGTQPEFAGR